MQTVPRPYHRGDLRSALLTRAEETLREKGAAGLSLRELTRDLGVTHAAPRRHFKDKQALLDALALIGFERLGETVTAAQQGAGESFAEQLDAVARGYVGFAMANPAMIDLMCSIKPAPEASEAVHTAVQRFAQQVIDMIGEGQRRGEVREGPWERVALPVFTTLRGYASMAVSEGPPLEMNEHGIDDVIAHILRGCAPD